jgi:hypothetical protein
MTTMLIQVAVINHRHGTNVYLAETFEGVEKQVFEYVKDYWDDLDAGKMPNDKSESALIQMYFEKSPDETYDYCESELKN